ncbi:xanthine dehydrogenase small subunit [Luteipulveratus mongoliensis]|uniref:Dehydrogenase n=1 Tax=Luteipulveratus mongoliensis TaxID=571913 RepID=A0A0K1JJV6_9MICO|nr:FAD binding domain-containing protein [Luteipulveratus mongoliensis]AKU16855.1 dehydrogenase [Luteipulveratus mongoliensis]
MSSPAEITVNGVRRSLSDATPHTSLLTWLRGQGLTGAKEGCAEGECGACSVLVARADQEHGARWTALNACLPPALGLDGQEIVTAEGLGSPVSLHPVQREMALRGGSQCGYCTPGFVCSMAAEFYRPDRAADGDDNGFDPHALSGNLCRCTGYRPILEAAAALDAPAQDDTLTTRLAASAPTAAATHLEADGAAYDRPADLATVLGLLAEDGEVRVVAGATDWGVDVNLKHVRDPRLVAIDHLAELRELEVSDDQITIGAALTLSEIERSLDARVPLLDKLFPLFASRLIRNAATIGGNLGTGSPIGDCAPVLLALDASVRLVSAAGERVVPLADYFTGYRTSVRRPDELIAAVVVPLPLAEHTTFVKAAKRRYDDISSVAVAIAIRLDGGAVTGARIGLGGVAATPVRAKAAEDALTGQPWDEAHVAAVADLLAAEGTPIDDHRASCAYRQAMLRQALLRAHLESTEQEVPA